MKRTDFKNRLKEFQLIGVLRDTPPPGMNISHKRKTFFFGEHLYMQIKANKRGDRVVGVELKGDLAEINSHLLKMKLIVHTTPKGRAKLKRQGIPHLTPNQFFKMLKMLMRGELK